MKVNGDYLIKCGFECDVEMNLSVHYWKDNVFEIISFEEMDFERENDWELIIFSEKDRSYGNVRLIAHTDDLEIMKQLLQLYNINPKNYFK